MAMHVLWDDRNKFFYMKADAPLFYAYSEKEKCMDRFGASFQSFEVSEDALFNMLYNFGFSSGYFDNELVRIAKNKISYYNRNPNLLYFKQYQLCHDEEWLKSIRREKLYALCKVTEKDALFATVTDENTGRIYILTFTDIKSIPDNVLQCYSDFTPVRYPLNAAHLLNFEIPFEKEETAIVE